MKFLGELVNSMSIIKNLRKTSGLTQSELAKQSSLSLRTIQRLESSNNMPKGYTLQALAKVFNIAPEAIQDEFKAAKLSNNDDITKIRFINLSVLSFIGIPFGNILVPFILWWRNRKSKHVDEIGRRIINFQILFTVVLSILLSLSPFISRKLFSNTSVILYVLFFSYLFNIVLVFVIARKLQHKDFNFLNFKLRLI
ncbi:MAG: helix-turn-helix domain-containing protein [Winogradskyella sp.]|uniref:helix-turn-helix domain-containing protein n=1 Tax=Winogradskyella sp. TaxID=1883156 RepID=UPI000F3AF49C|nr:helix-turn-helix domain-containing protein [Winogradskyella sp.]RNC87010.1 MAG: helix-turn-helix domain-containing protein [Winogradskyella sp.]